MMNSTWEALSAVPWYGHSIVTTANLSMTLAIGSPPSAVYTGYHRIYQSLDRGCSWQVLEDAGLPQDTDMVHVALSSATGQHAYVVTDSMSIYASSDFAQSWEYVYQPSQTGSPYDYLASGLITSPSGQFVAACGGWDDYTSEPYFMAISTDYGTTWSLRDLPEYCWSIAADANFSTIWLSAHRNSFHPVWKSTNLGATWIELEGFGFSTDSKFSCSHSGQYVALVGGSPSYFSSDYGQNFSYSKVFGTSSGVYGANEVVSDVTGRHLAASLDGIIDPSRGLFVSHDFGQTWRLSRDISDTYPHGLASSGDGSVLLAASEDEDGGQKEIFAGSLQPMGSYCPQEDPSKFPLYAIIIIAVVGGLIVCIGTTAIVLCLRSRSSP